MEQSIIKNDILMNHFNILLMFIVLITPTSSLLHDNKEVRFTPIIHLEHYGKVRGLIQNAPMTNWSSSANDIYFYQGIPYGKAKRFERPTPADNWTGIYDAIKFRDACPQSINVSEHINTFSEDCLFLNVWTTKSAISNPSYLLPVMVWIHGGGFKSGTIFSIIFDGGMLAANGNLVVVSVAYRLGPFGFLYSGDHQQQAQGNQGLHDQILALHWIQKNIHNFGGDPNQVTVFGQSAGAMSVGSLILSPLARNLFQRAIMQSGAPNSLIGCTNKSQALSNMIQLATILKCYNNTNENLNAFKISEIMSCLRLCSMEDLTKANQELDERNEQISMIPIYGDDLMPLNPVEALKTGNGINKVDLIFGVNRDEGTMFVRNKLNNPNITIHQTQDFIRYIMKKSSYAEDVVQFYTKHLNDQSTFDEKRHAVADAFGDYQLVCPTILFGEEFAQRFNNINIYLYRLMAPVESLFGQKWMGVTHGQDIIYIFGLPYRLKGIKFSQQVRELSRDMMGAWIRFAKTGHQGPMGNTVIKWTKAFTGKTRNSSTEWLMSLDSQHYHMVKDFFKQTCDQFWRNKIFF